MSDNISYQQCCLIQCQPGSVGNSCLFCHMIQKCSFLLYTVEDCRYIKVQLTLTSVSFILEVTPELTLFQSFSFVVHHDGHYHTMLLNLTVVDLGAILDSKVSILVVGSTLHVVILTLGDVQIQFKNSDFPKMFCAL